MTKFNVIQKKRRASVAERKRQLHGHPLTGKLKHKPQTTTISGKRKRKLLKKWRRDQKEAIEKGIITMEDVEMAIAEGASQDISKKSPTKFHVKKTAKFKIKQLKGKGKNKKNSSKPASVEAPKGKLTYRSLLETQVDVMVE